MSKRKVTPAIAKDVRSFFKQHTDLVPEGAEKSLAQGARGRLNPKAVEVFNAQSGMVYAEGNKAEPTVTIPVTKADANGRSRTRKVEVPVSGARALAGDLAGARGRLSPAALAGAGEAYAASL